VTIPYGCDAGMDIGSHTVDHLELPSLDDA